jgi:hypothetical protein
LTTATPWIPFVDPLYAVIPHLSQWWFLGVFPVLIAISVVYRAVRLPPSTSLKKILISSFWTFFICVAAAAIICFGLLLFYHVASRHLPLPVG